MKSVASIKSMKPKNKYMNIMDKMDKSNRIK